MTITLATPGRNAACDGTVDRLDTGSGAAKFRIRAGSTTLCDISLPNPAFGSASSGTASAAGLPLSGTGVAAGNADGYQALDRDGTVVWSGSVGVSGSGADAIIDNVSIAIGQTVNLTSWTQTQPA